MRNVLAVLAVLAATGFAAVVWAADEAAPAKEGPAVKAADEPKPAEAPKPPEAPKPEEPKIDVVKASYALGVDIGRNLRRQGIPIDPEQFTKGLRDVLGGKPAMDSDEVSALLEAFNKYMAGTQEQRMKDMAERNKKEGEAFLADNKGKEGVVTLPNGLQYKILKEGTGSMPKVTDTVNVNYRGTLIDGTVFDASVRHGGPATFPVNRVIKGWTEALQLMKVGSKWMVYVPSDLGYGPEPRAPGGANSTLIFEVELVGIEPPPPPPPPPVPGPAPAPQPAPPPAPPPTP